MKIKKLSVFCILSIMAFPLFACSTNDSNHSQNNEDYGQNDSSSQSEDDVITLVSGEKAFLPDTASNFEIIFFDTDNVISDDGDSFSNVINNLGSASKSNNCSDCYMIKCGDIEILVDCGNQLHYGQDNNRVKNFCTNIARKILTYCTDGVLDYLIVTHADFDHIENLSINGGFFDMILDYDYWFSNYYSVYNDASELKNIYNESSQPITTISNIIDFDSYRVRKNSSNSNGNENLLISTEVYKQYVLKRDKVIDKCDSAYSPAGSFFNTVTGDTKDSTYHNFSAIPYYYYNLIYEKTNGKGLEPNLRTLIDDKIKNTFTNNNYKKSVSGKLNKINTDSGNRYTFDIELKNASKLRILYNWYYDSYYNKSFDSQDRNNISICMLIESGSSKLLLLGDLGGNGESGLLRYYAGTDVLKGISCFKLSHHGSTINGENSYALFNTISEGVEEIILIVTGVAQPSRSFYDHLGIVNENQSIYSSLSSVACMEPKLFQNINCNYTLLCTQIVKTDDNLGFYNQPFYGDIHISFSSSSSKLMYTFIGEISTYIKNIDNDIEKSKFKFKTYNDKSFVSIQDLEWFRKVGLKEGK